MRENFFIGIDAGTTSVKGVLADADGKILSVSIQEYILEMEEDRCELDAEIYWEKTKMVIRELLDSVDNANGQVQALSFSSQGETLICVDSNGAPVRRAIV